MDNLASRLGAARNRKGWSQEQLAAAAGVSQGTVGNIESGIRKGGSSLAVIAEALEVRYRWLRDGDGLMELENGWPFPGIDRRRFDRLPHDAKSEIQGVVRDRIDRLEQAYGLPNGINGQAA